jgi:DNA-binding MarR family transcriptional regulator
VSRTEPELEVLSQIYRSEESVRQREIARLAGISLGMTNVIIKRLARKGWVSVRKVNNRNIRYVVTPKGVDQIMRRSYRYLRRTLHNVVEYRSAVEDLARSVKGWDRDGILLVGTSDLDFLVEYACGKYGLSFERSDADRRTSLFKLYSEVRLPGSAAQRQSTDVAYLSVLLGG